MAATTQTDLNNFSNLVEADGTITNAQRAQVQTHMYAISRILFGNNFTPQTNGHSG